MIVLHDCLCGRLGACASAIIYIAEFMRRHECQHRSALRLVSLDMACWSYLWPCQPLFPARRRPFGRHRFSLCDQVGRDHPGISQWRQPPFSAHPHQADSPHSGGAVSAWLRTLHMRLTQLPVSVWACCVDEDSNEKYLRGLPVSLGMLLVIHSLFLFFLVAWSKYFYLFFSIKILFISFNLFFSFFVLLISIFDLADSSGVFTLVSSEYTQRWGPLCLQAIKEDTLTRYYRFNFNIYFFFFLSYFLFSNNLFSCYTLNCYELTDLIYF